MNKIFTLFRGAERVKITIQDLQMSWTRAMVHCPYSFYSCKGSIYGHMRREKSTTIYGYWVGIDHFFFTRMKRVKTLMINIEQVDTLWHE